MTLPTSENDRSHAEVPPLRPITEEEMQAIVDNEGLSQLLVVLESRDFCFDVASRVIQRNQESLRAQAKRFVIAAVDSLFPLR